MEGLDSSSHEITTHMTEKSGQPCPDVATPKNGFPGDNDKLERLQAETMARALIIDDDQIMSKTLAYLIKSTGHDVQYVLTLKDALTLIAGQPFDVVLLDVAMPDGSGLKAVQEIKESPSKPEVIIIPADGDPDGAELALRCGAWDYIEKSPSIKDLLLPPRRRKGGGGKQIQTHRGHQQGPW